MMIFEKRNIDHPFRSFFPPIICGDCLLYASDLVHCGKCSRTRMRGSGPIRLRIRTAILVATYGWARGAFRSGYVSARRFLSRSGRAKENGSPGRTAGVRSAFFGRQPHGPGGPLRMAFHPLENPPLPGKRPPEKRSLRGSWRQTTRSFAKEPTVNISIATDAAGSALPSKGKKKSEAIRSLAGRFVHPPITAAGPFPCPAQKVRTKMFVQNPAPSPGSTIFRRWNSFAPASFYTYSWTSSKFAPPPDFFRFPHIL